MTGSPISHNPRRPDGLLVMGILVALIAFISCVHTARHRGLEYDELWSLQRYARQGPVSRLFEDLATPNNHPLHSWLVRAVAGTAGVPEWRARLPSLTAGLFVLALVPCLAWWLTKNIEVRFLSMVWCATSAPLLHFAQTSRGYAMQTAFLTGCACLLAAARERRRGEQWKLAGAVACGWGAVLTLPTSVMFVIPLFAGDLVWRLWDGRRMELGWGSLIRRERNVLVAAGIWLIPAGLWLWHIGDALLEAQQMFGAPLDSLSAWAQFSWVTLGSLFSLPILLLLLLSLGWRGQRAPTYWLAGVIIFPLLLAPLTSAGPARAYVAVIPFGMVLTASGFVALLDLWRTGLSTRGRTILVVLAALLPLAHLRASLLKWTPLDWSAAVPELQKQLPPDVYISYSAATGYVVGSYFFHELREDFVRRAPTGKMFSLALLENKQQLQGIDPQTVRSILTNLPASSITQTESIAGVAVTLFQVHSWESVRNSNGLILAAIGPGALDQVKATLAGVIAANPQTHWLAVNGLFNPVIIPEATPGARGAILLAATGTPPPPQELEELSRRYDGLLRFYAIGP